MLLELCEFCCAGAAHLSGAGLRCRRHGRLCFGAEGLEELEAPRIEDTSAGAGGGPGEMSRKARRDRGEILGYFGAEGACAATRGCRERVKGAPYEAETRGSACKGVSAVRRHAGGLYDAGSYCYTLVKCLKPFVRNRKRCN
jgi:hypothetical protein